LTLLTFQKIAEAYLIKTKLESSGIHVFLENEYNSQLVPQGTEPRGPVKKRIREKDLNKAIKLLKETQYIKEHPNRISRQSLWMKTIDKMTQKLPVIQNLPLQLRLIFSVAIILVILALIVSIIALPKGFLP
jgi:hypothetical protein